MKQLLTFLFISLSSGAAFAYDFSGADATFALRENNPAKISQARAFYQSAIDSGLSPEDLIYSVEQMSRLDLYLTSISTDNEEVKHVSLRCYDNTAKIAFLKPDSDPVYFFWRATCLALWGRANGLMASLSRSGELTDLIEAGNKIDSTYEGGGFYRLGAAVYSKLPFINPFGPRGDIEKANQYVDAALASAAYYKAADPETATGDYYFNSYQFKAEILIKLNKKDEAIAVLKQAIQRLRNGDLPIGREAETKVHLVDLQRTLAEIQ